LDQHTNRIKALTYDYPEAIPVSVYMLPAAWVKHREALHDIVDAHPMVFGEQAHSERDYGAVSGTFLEGTHVDAWGCVWENVAQGLDAIVKHHPVPTREDVHRLKPPTNDAGLPHGFMYLRLADLRGFEQIMMDFAEEPPELQMLIDIVLQYNLRQVAKRLETLGEGDNIVYFGDDLGMQTSLPMSPRKWRQYLKPCYAAIYKPIVDSGRYVYMHSDGHIVDIIPDLIDCGVSVLNPQVGANGLDALAKACKGRVCVDLDLDRQMFPFGSPAEIDEHVRDAVETLGGPEGGLWLKAEIGPDVPLRNVEALCLALERYRGPYA